MTSLSPAPAGGPAVRSGTLRGMAYMLASTVFFTVMSALIRHVSEHVHAVEITFFRFLFGLLFLTPVLLRHGLKPFATQRLPLHFVRAGLNVGMTVCLFTALAITPLAMVSALHFTAPLFTALIAVLFLGEGVRVRRIAALLAGFAGTLVIVRPGDLGISVGTVLVLASAIQLAAMMVLVKVISRDDSSLTTVIYTAVLVTPVSFVAALFFWTAPTWTELAFLAAIGVLGTLGQYSINEAFKVADITAILPLNFVSLIWSALMGFFFFAEVPAVATFVGGAMIFSAATYIAVREQQVARQPPGAPPRGAPAASAKG